MRDASTNLEPLFFNAGVILLVAALALAYRWARFRFVKTRPEIAANELPHIDFVRLFRWRRGKADRRTGACAGQLRPENRT